MNGKRYFFFWLTLYCFSWLFDTTFDGESVPRTEWVMSQYIVKQQLLWSVKSTHYHTNILLTNCTNIKEKRTKMPSLVLPSKNFLLFSISFDLKRFCFRRVVSNSFRYSLDDINISITLIKLSPYIC